MKYPLMKFVLALLSSCIGINSQAADDSRIERTLPIGEWDAVRLYILSINGGKGEGVDLEKLNKMHIRFSSNRFFVFKDGSSTPSETGSLKILRIAGARPGLIEMEDKTNGTMRVLYRVCDNRLELCINEGTLGEEPKQFGAKDSVVMVLVTTQRNRLISINQRMPRNVPAPLTPVEKK